MRVQEISGKGAQRGLCQDQTSKSDLRGRGQGSGLSKGGPGGFQAGSMGGPGGLGAFRAKSKNRKKTRRGAEQGSRDV